MNDIREKLKGVFPPMMTPFREDQTLDTDALAYNVDKYNETDIAGLMPLGSNGEFRSLDDEESLQVVRIVRKYLKPGKSLMVGAGRESAYSTVGFARSVADEGADFISLLTPYYFLKQMNDDAMLRYYTYVADRSPVPVLVYCAPKFSGGLVISPAVISRLAEHPNIVGMKDTSAEPIEGYVDAAKGKDFHVLAGTINKYYEALCVGGVGGVLSAANYLPQQCCRIQALFESGKREEAQRLAEAIKALTKQCSGSSGIPGTKACMTLMGFRGGYPRLPLAPIPDEEVARIAEALKKSEELDAI